MDLIVGYDLTSHGDDALRAALWLAAMEESLSMGVVHVVTQQALDKTGGLSADEKASAAIEVLYPLLWKRVNAVRDAIEEPTASPDLEVDVLVRFAPVHLARAEERIAIELLRVAVDFNATRIVLGKRGRPDSVAERISLGGSLEPSPSGFPPGVFCLRVDPGALAIDPSGVYRSDPT